MRKSSLLVVLFLLASTTCFAAIFPQGRGAWPEDWPKELEPLREKSRTLGVGTGIQESIYEIPIPDRETFDRLWPVILKLRTPGGPLKLYRAGSASPKGWGDLLSNKEPTIRIYGPSGGLSLAEEIDVQNPPDFEKLIKEGRALKAKAPWPIELIQKHGKLPEYVTSKKDKEGKLRWVAADPTAKDQEVAGFFNRARIDIELVVDGKIIDLNRLRFPDGVKVIDYRFDEEPASR
ncbi:MAG: hypothetical protein CMJ64_11975 [Planctomycetaceae bacterium]|nr:hypothetical protein [Planctomycetaceae bacterium]